jgi:hypothetical protein
LKRITGQATTAVDLLIVTHSHDDHVGCLPRMVEAGTLTAKFALVSDPALRWPENGATDAAELGDMGRQLLDVLGEELPDPALDRDGFDAALDVARELKTRYRDMIATLKQRGTKIVRYQTDPIKPITDALKGRGVKFRVVLFYENTEVRGENQSDLPSLLGRRHAETEKLNWNRRSGRRGERGAED